MYAFKVSSEDDFSQTQDHVLCHRVVEIHQNQYFVTKGDSNKHDDRWMFSKAKHRQFGLERHHLIGKIHARLPYVGLPVLIVRETYWGKVGTLLFSWLHTPVTDKRPLRFNYDLLSKSISFYRYFNLVHGGT